MSIKAQRWKDDRGACQRVQISYIIGWVSLRSTQHFFLRGVGLRSSTKPCIGDMLPDSSQVISH